MPARVLSTPSVGYHDHPAFGIQIPKICPNVPTEILDPRNTWSDKKAYNEKANRLAWQFDKNFEKFAALASDTIREGAPQPAEVSNEYNHN